MKKIILILLLSFSSFLGYSQLNEGFEGAPTNPDASGVWALPSSAAFGTWFVTDNQTDVNPNFNWRLQNPGTPFLANTGDKAAYIDRQNTGAVPVGEPDTEEWLITPRLTITASSQFRFFSRQTFAGNRGTRYQIRVSSDPDQTNLSAFTVLAEYDEDQLSSLTPDQLDYEEKILNLTFTGQRYFAFVKVFRQLGAQTDGDRWLLDDVRIVERCQDPLRPLGVENTTSTSTTFTWTAPATGTYSQYEIQYGESGFPLGSGQSTGTITVTNPANPKYTLLSTQPLTPGTLYQFYVRTICSDSNSEWTGPFNFPTPPRGSVCADPKVVPVLPYQDNSNTTIYGNNITPTGPGTSGCGATGNFLGGNDVVYSYTPLVTGFLNIKLNPLGATNTGVFVYGSCAAIGNTCLAGVGNSNANIREIPSLSVTAGTPIYIVLSSLATTPTYGYILTIQEANCTPPLLASLHADPFGTTSGTLDWTNGTGSSASSWQVAVQPFGAIIPPGPGVTAGTNDSFLVNATVDGTPLTPGTEYQFWVRADCGNGLFSPWTGPVAFNTSVCEEVDKCDYTFVLRDTGNNGWQNGTMQVKQNGIVIATLGTQLANNSGGPANVTVKLCHNLPFELFWSTAGSNPGQIRIAVNNSFGQTLYSLATSSPTLVGTTLFADLVDCLNPKCQIPTGVTVPVPGIFTDRATVNWTSSGTPTIGWDIFFNEVGQPAPGPGATANYNVSAPGPTTFELINLDADTQYNVYIRSVCSVNGPSAWTTAVPFTTIPTCYKPTPLAVATATITTNSAVLNWTNGQGTNSNWEILLIPAIQGINGPEAPPAPLDTPVLAPGTLLFPTGTGGPFTTPTTLAPATIYYYYIRTVCSPTDSSNWAGPIIFNTVTCAATDKCNYKFLLTSPAGNTWNGSRIQVRQNGIVVQTLGAGQINNAAGVTVGICPGVPFDLYWSTAGTSPEVVGISVVNPFLDVLYTKAPGDGTPLTVLFQSVGNCTAAPCSKPTGMAVTTTATSATLTWTDNSIPPSANFALYVVTTGDPAPTNIPPSAPTHTGVASGVTITSLNGTTGTPLLQPSTSYTYYVKALCVDASTSTWTVLTPTTFITKPLNDECLTATAVPVNPSQQCVTSVPGSTLGATASLPTITAPLTNCGATSNDVWYSFVATSPNHTINLTDLAGTPATATLSHSVFSGACDNLTKLYCTNTLSSAATGLTIGNTYYIRVYNSATTANQFVTFKICITSPPVNDVCEGALDVPVNPNQVCNVKTAGNTLGATPSLPAGVGAGCTTTDDDVWFKFVATNDIHIINISGILPSPSTATIAVNHAFLSGSCGTLTNVYCSTAAESVATGLVIGQTYYIRVYTAGSVAGQSVTFNVCIKTPPPPGPNNECANALPVVVNPSSVCNTSTPGNIIGATGSTGVPGTCIGNANDDVWFTFTATSPRHFINLLNVEGTTQDLNHAVYSGACGTLTLKYCSTAGSLTSNNATFVPGQTYYIRVWSNSAASQVVTFNVCVKSVSTCQNATPFCGSSADDPFIFENTTGITSTGQIACLGSNPNPTYYTLHVGETGPLEFNIVQNTAFTNGQPTGQTLDVDYVAWGPFSSTQACSQIAFADCPTCPNNTTDPNFYPFGNIVDCSFDGSFTETLSIPNAQADEYYIILITNYSDDPGFIKLIQTNFTAPGAGETICCSVGLGPDKSVCDPSVTLNALEDVEDINNVPATFQWYFNGSTTPIPGETGATITVTQSGTYKVTGSCGLNPVDDDILVTFNVTPAPVTTLTQATCLVPTGTVEVTAPVDTTGILASNIYISQFTDELAGSLSYLELYNGTGASVDLSNYKIKVYTNGATTTTCITTLSGIMPNNSTFVIRLSNDANAPGVTPPTITIPCGGVNFNDNVQLTTIGDVIVDNWGRTDGVGFTPSNQAGYNYERNTNAVAPNPGWDPADWTVTDWTATVLPDYGNLGAYTPAIVSTYQYNIDGGPWQSSTTFTGVAVGVHTINVKNIVTGCTSSASIEITAAFTNTPVTTFTYTTPICKNDTNPQLPDTSATGFATGGQFTADSPLLSINPTTGEIDLALSTAGSYIVKYEVASDLANCFGPGSTTFSIVINPVLTPDFPVIPSFCSGTTPPVLGATSPNGVSGTWNPPTVDNTADGTYVFTPDAGQCAVPQTLTVTITAPNITPVFAAINPFCSGTVAPTLPTTSQNSITGIWQPTTISNTQDGSYVFTPNAGQCALPVTINVTVTPTLTPDFAPIAPICNGAVVPVLNTTSPNGISGTWQPATIDPTQTGNYVFTPTTGQCANTQTLEVIISSNPVFDVTGACVNGSYTLTVTSATDFTGATFIWRDPLGNIVGGNQPTLVVTQTGNHTVEITNLGCTTTSPAKNVINISCIIQKGISPKGTGIGDGLNDSFDLTGQGVSKLEIFNRYGTKVYSKSRYTNEWYGQSDSGDELPDGTYFYVIEYDAQDTKTGWIYINHEQ